MLASGGVSGEHRRGGQRHRGSHVTDRDCRLRPGHLRKRRRPRPRERSLLCPWADVLLVDLSLSRPIHPLSAVVEGRCQLQLDRHLDVTVERTELALTRLLAAPPTRSAADMASILQSFPYTVHATVFLRKMLWRWWWCGRCA